MVKHFSFLLFCTIVLSFFVACSKDSDEDIKNTTNSYTDYMKDDSLTEYDKMLVGHWSGGTYKLSNIYIFADNIVYNDDGEGIMSHSGLGYWLYNVNNNVFSIIRHGLWGNAEINISNISYQYMSGLRAGYEEPISYIKQDNKSFIYVYFKISERYYGIDIYSIMATYFFENPDEFFSLYVGNIDSNENIVIPLNSGKKIIIKNPFYLKKSSIIYDDIEYKFNASLLP